MNELRMAIHEGFLFYNELMAYVTYRVVHESILKVEYLPKSTLQKDLEQYDICIGFSQLASSDKLEKRKNGIPYADFGKAWDKYGISYCRIFMEEFLRECLLNFKKGRINDFVILFLERYTNLSLEEIESGKSDNITINERHVINRANTLKSYIDLRYVQMIDAYHLRHPIPETKFKPLVGNIDFDRTARLNAIVDSTPYLRRIGGDFSYARRNLNDTIRTGFLVTFTAELFHQSFVESIDKRLLVLKVHTPVEEFIHILEVYNNVEWVIYPLNDIFYLRGLNKFYNDYTLRRECPEKWKGKEGLALELETGIKGSLFCHLHGHLIGVATKEAAIHLGSKILKESS